MFLWAPHINATSGSGLTSSNPSLVPHPLPVISCPVPISRQIRLDQNHLQVQSFPQIGHKASPALYIPVMLTLFFKMEPAEDSFHLLVYLFVATENFTFEFGTVECLPRSQLTMLRALKFELMAKLHIRI